jgi:aldehyde dehydrogenase (NAD+)
LIVSTNPLADSDVLARMPEMDGAGVEKAAATARDAQPEWAGDPGQRTRMLLAAAADLEAASQELADLIVREVGKPIVEAEGEVARTAAVLRYHATAAMAPVGELLPPADGQGLLLTRRSPRGLVGLITPFNFPLAIPAWKAAPALALGNAVLLKPSPLALATAARFVEILSRHLPAGVLTLCAGGAETAQAVLAVVDALSFTGSTAAGRAVAVAAAGAQLPVQTENGGHNNVIVLPDADAAAVAAIVARDVAGYVGQKCTSTRRVLACGGADELAEAIVAELAQLPLGDPSRREVVGGPLISQPAAAAAEDAVTASRAQGAGVHRVPAPDGSPFVAPTVVRDDEGTSPPSREEVFGPVVVVQGVRDTEEAVTLVNSGAARLVGAIHTRDLDRALELAGRLRAGMVRVNAPTTGVDFHAPFGGEGDSGYGPREQGRAADALFTTERTITIRPAGSRA